MKKLALTSLGLALVLVTGCSSSAETVTDPYTGGPGLEAPATSTANYPEGPYGVRVGSTLADASFFGYPSATDQTLKLISFHDYYDPDGSKGIKLIYFSAGAIWCPPCNSEAADLANAKDGGVGGASTLASKLGVQFLQNLTQGANHDSAYAANESDLRAWLKSHPLPFPVFLDPSRKLEIYFDANGIPFGMIIDPRTMKILRTTDGWFGSDSSLSAAEQLDQRLKAFEEELTPYLAK